MITKKNIILILAIISIGLSYILIQKSFEYNKYYTYHHKINTYVCNYRNLYGSMLLYEKVMQRQGFSASDLKQFYTVEDSCLIKKIYFSQMETLECIDTLEYDEVYKELETQFYFLFKDDRFQRVISVIDHIDPKSYIWNKSDVIRTISFESYEDTIAN